MLAILVLGVAGCGGVPVSGPHAREVIGNSGSSDPSHVGYVVVEVTPEVCQQLAHSEALPLRTMFGNEAPPAYIIHVGDVLSVSVWEASASSLFTAPQVVAATPLSRGTTLPPIVVEQDGMIAVPFAGRLAVAGKTPLEAEKAITAALSGKADTPQVVVSIARSQANTVTVGGEVGRGALVTLGIGGYRILDAIAEVGGVRVPVTESLVRLTRGSRTASVPYSELLRDPGENIYLQPGDVVTVVRSPKTFTAFGALGRNYQIPFETETLSVEEAIAKSGGLQDQRVDPAGIFVFRNEPSDVVARLAPGHVNGEAVVPVVFHIDMSNAGSYFLARNFAVQDKDIFYAANAELNEVQKFVSLLGSILSPAATGASMSAAVR